MRDRGDRAVASYVVLVKADYMSHSPEVVDEHPYLSSVIPEAFGPHVSEAKPAQYPAYPLNPGRKLLPLML